MFKALCNFLARKKYAKNQCKFLQWNASHNSKNFMLRFFEKRAKYRQKMREGAALQKKGYRL